MIKIADKPQKSKRGRIAGGFVNSLKEIIPGWWHFKRTDDLELVPTKQMRPFREMLKDRLNELKGYMSVEENYGHVDDLLKPLGNIYKELRMYYDEETVRREQIMAAEGTDTEDVDLKIRFNKDGETEVSEIFPVKIPAAKEIRYPDGSVQKVTYFGFSQMDEWLKIYKGAMENIFEEAKTYYHKKINADGNIDPADKDEHKRSVDKQLDTLKGRYDIMLGHLISAEGNPLGCDSIFQRGKETERELGIMQEEVKKLETPRNDIFTRISKKTLYARTYRVIVPYYYDERRRVYVDLEHRHFTLPVGVASPIYPGEKRPLSRGGWDEFELGKDEYGEPLEVATPGYEFDDEPIPAGTVLLDVFLNRPRRVVDYRFTKELPVNAIQPKVSSEWDEYRDDLRDARYHRDTITVIDYIMASNKPLGGEWSTKLRPWSIGTNYRRYNMLLGDGRQIAFERRTSNLLPGFDLRAFNKPKKYPFLHLGKKRYYTDWTGVDFSVDNIAVKGTAPHIHLQNFGPVITSRGLSMFIIDHICKNGKSFKEIHEDILSVSKKTGGYDYGPRTFNTDLWPDPFNVGTGKVNKEMELKLD